VGRILYSCLNVYPLSLHCNFPTRLFRLTVYAIMGLVSCCCLGFIIRTFAICHPIKYNWNKTVHGSCGDFGKFSIAGSISNMILDIVDLGLVSEKGGRPASLGSKYHDPHRRCNASFASCERLELNLNRGGLAEVIWRSFELEQAMTPFAFYGSDCTAQHDGNLRGSSRVVCPRSILERTGLHLERRYGCALRPG
jgi:hypothetical protein